MISVPVANLKRIEGGKVEVPLRDLVAPPRQYVADAATFVREASGNRYRCVFWQRAADELSAASVVAVVMSPDAVAKFLESVATYVPEVQRKTAARGLLPENVAPPPADRGPVAVLKANAIRVAAANSENTWDFYDITPLGLHISADRQRNLPIEAVVRVELTSPLALAIIGEMLKFRSDLPSDPD